MLFFLLLWLDTIYSPAGMGIWLFPGFILEIMNHIALDTIVHIVHLCGLLPRNGSHCFADCLLQIAL